MLEASAFGSFELRRNGERVPIKLLWARKLIGLLLLRPGHEWSRDAVCGYLWPDAEIEVGRNRLRTTLVEVRAALEPDAHLEADRHHLRLTSEDLENPLQKAKLLTRRVQAAEDQAAELGAIDRLLAVIDQDLFADWEDEWIIAERAVWEQRRAEARLRRSQLRAERGDLEGAIHDAEILLERSGYDEAAWRVYLVAMERNGEPERALDKLRTAQRELKETGLSFSEELLETARSIRNRGVSSTPLVTEEMSRFVGNVLQRMLEMNPVDALKLLGTDAARMEVFREPRLSNPVYELVLSRTSETSESRRRALLNYLQGQSIQHETDEILRHAPQIVEEEPSLPMRRTAANLLGFAHFQIREYDRAQHYGELVLQYGHEANDDLWIVSAEGQLASFAWHQGKYEEAVQVYLDCMGRFEKIDHPLAKLNTCVMSSNLSIVLTIMEDYELAEAWADRASELRTRENYTAVNAMANPVRGFIKFMRGQPSEGAEAIIRGLGAGLRTNDKRSFEIGLDYLAGALGVCGHGAQGMAVAQRATELRAPRRHVRSVAEERQYATVRRLCSDAKPDAEWTKIERLSELVARGTDLIS